MDHNFVYQA